MIVPQIIVLSLLAPALIEVLKYDDTALVDMSVYDICHIVNPRQMSHGWYGRRRMKSLGSVC